MDKHVIQRKKYKKDFSYSYTLGAFPTFELVLQAPETVLAVYVHSKSTINIEEIEKKAAVFGFDIIVDDKMFQVLSHKKNCFLIGFFKKTSSLLSDTDTHILLDAPSDFGNFGTIIRTALGFLVTDIAVILPSVDIYHPEVIRASMGAFFKVNINCFHSFEAYAKRYEKKRDFYPFIVDRRGKEISDITFLSPSTLIFGNEATGLPEFYKDVGTPLYIAHSQEIDSLNLPMAVGIGLYQLYSQQML